MTTTNDKLRSLFLAALMVFSVFAMTVALPGSAAANHNDFTDSDADDHLNYGERYWGETVLISGSADATYELWKVNSNDPDEFEKTLVINDEGYTTFSTDGLDGTYTIKADGATDSESGVAVSNGQIGSGSSGTFSVTTQTFDASFEDADVTDEDEDVELTIDTNRGTHAVNVTADGLDGEELRNIFTNYETSDGITRNGDFSDYNVDGDTLTLNSVNSGDYRTNFSGVNTGEYTFNFEVTDTEASSSASINVSDAADGDVVFANDVPQDQVGDVADITLEMSNTDKGTITIGSADQNYWITAHVTDEDDDGEVTVQFNSYTAGAQGSSDVTLNAEGDDTVVTSSIEQGGEFSHTDYDTDGDGITEGDDSYLDAGDKLLDATEYDMNVTAGHNDGSGADEVGALSLQDRSTDNVTIMTAPEAFDKWSDADAINAGMGSNVTQADEIAQQDYVVVQIEASGLEGYYESLGETKTPFLSADAGATNLLVEEANPGANSNANSIDWTSADMDEEYGVVADADNNTYYVAINTENKANGDDAFDFEQDTEYTAEFSVYDKNAGDSDNDDNVLNFHDDDEDETVSSNFDVVAGETNFDLNEDDLVLVEAADNQTVSGTTNWAPGSELTLSIESDDSTSPFLTRPDAEVQPDGTFEANADFSDLSEGTNLTITLDHLSENFDEDGQVVAQVSEETETATPTETTETATEEP
ncbi:surface glycoprotein, partial [Halomicrobium zhouii]